MYEWNKIENHDYVSHLISMLLSLGLNNYSVYFHINVLEGNWVIGLMIMTFT